MFYGVAYGSQWPVAGERMHQWINDTARLAPGGWARIELDWGMVQPTDSSHWDWSWCDQIVTWTTAAGLNVLFLIAGPPAWANDGNAAHCKPTSNAQFATFAAAAATRYASLGVHTWEIGNEVNNAAFWNGTTAGEADYVALLSAVTAAIKAVDASAYVIAASTGPLGGGVGGDSDTAWLSAVVSAGMLSHCDAIGSHPYTAAVLASNTADWNAFSHIARNATSFVSILTAAGQSNFPIWITEFGWPTYGPGVQSQSNTCWSEIGCVPGAQCETETYEVQLVTDFVTQSKLVSNVKACIWFGDQDYGTNPANREDWYGLRRIDGTCKPAWAAFKAAIA